MDIGEVICPITLIKDGNFDYTLRRYKKDAYRHVMEWLENK